MCTPWTLRLVDGRHDVPEIATSPLILARDVGGNLNGSTSVYVVKPVAIVFRHVGDHVDPANLALLHLEGLLPFSSLKAVSSAFFSPGNIELH